jgi:hypothetical protein
MKSFDEQRIRKLILADLQGRDVDEQGTILATYGEIVNDLILKFPNIIGKVDRVMKRIK